MSSPTNYANPGKRLVAYIIDAVILGVVFGVIAMILVLPTIGSIAGAASEDMSDSESLSAIGTIVGSMGLLFVLSAVGGFLYFTLQESSKFQGTLGKRAMKIYVTDMKGHRLTFGGAAVRFLGRIVNGFTMSIGYLIIIFTEKKQGLHDMIASTLVLDGETEQTFEGDDVL